jgi:DMSO/TMAO reductase YedYZ molybdopterin-dependent catalytic subunit
MKAPWANVVLLVILVLQTVTGYLGMLNNQAQRAWILWLHGIGAYLILLLLFWKGSIILDAIRRKKVWTGQRWLFLLTLGLLLLTLVLGLVWTLNGPLYLGHISLVSWHIYAAVPLMALMLWHSWQMRFVFRLRQSRDRRALLRGGGLALAGLLTWQLANAGKRWAEPAGASRRFTGSYERGALGERFPVVSWLLDRPQPLDMTDWQLHVHGAVNQPLRLAYTDLLELPQTEQLATLDCTGGWYSTQLWRGVALAELLAMAGLQAGVESVTIRSATGYQRRFGLAEAEGALLALSVADAPLTHGHGYPLRLVVPEKRGLEWVKWVSDIQVNTTSEIWQSPLPLQ